MNTQLLHGDCIEKLKKLPDCSVEAVVTDPPYGLSFMGKKWDYDVPSVEVWAECLRVLKPGGHLLAFAGTRTQHRMAVRIEDAGFEIRDMIAWVYSTGFPKSLDVSKAIDKAAGAERKTKRIAYSTNVMQQGIGVERPWMKAAAESGFHELAGDIPATESAKQWQGWGTALKPALEPITVARKPLGEKTVAANVLEHGTGAINVDGCRVGTEATVTVRNGNSGAHGRYGKDDRVFSRENPPGRWPANLIHDGSDEVVGLFPERNGGAFPAVQNTKSMMMASRGSGLSPARSMNDSGSAARFFYCAKASKRDRDEGCEGREHADTHNLSSNACGRCGLRVKANGSGQKCECGDARETVKLSRSGNHHPTVKPTALMRYLCRLVTPPGGVVLDPFMGSGSTGKAAVLEGFRFIGIEREEEYLEIAKTRIAHASGQCDMLTGQA